MAELVLEELVRDLDQEECQGMGGPLEGKCPCHQDRTMCNLPTLSLRNHPSRVASCNPGDLGKEMEEWERDLGTEMEEKEAMEAGLPSWRLLDKTAAEKCRIGSCCGPCGDIPSRPKLLPKSS